MVPKEVVDKRNWCLTPVCAVSGIIVRLKNTADHQALGSMFGNACPFG